MRISVCDDEEYQLSLIGAYVSEYIGRKNMDINVKKFRRPYALLEYEKRNGRSDIYLLDIVMDDMSGLELGRRIRENNERAEIIFLTTAKEFSLDAFSVNAFSYLVKPFEKQTLFAELDKCLRRHTPPRKREAVITVKTADGMLPLMLSRINAVEYLDHRLIYNMTDGEKIVSVYQKAAFDMQTEELLHFGVFVKTSNSYIVNMMNIRTVTAPGFKMNNGAEFPVTRKYAAAKDRFLRYKLGNGD